MKVPSIRGSRLLVVVIASMLAQVALAQGVSGHWGSSMYEVRLSVAGETVSGTFTPLLDRDRTPGTISGRLQDGGKMFQAEWTRPMGAGQGGFNTLLALDSEGRVLVGYRWNEGFDPSSFSLHRAVDGEIPQLVDVDEFDGPPVADVPATPVTPTPETPGPVGGQVVICRSVEDGQPVGAGTVFDQLPEITLLHRYQDAAVGPAEAAWFRDGDEIVRSVTHLRATDRSVEFTLLSGHAPLLPAGRYEVELTMPGRAPVRTAFTMGQTAVGGQTGPATPATTAPPVTPTPVSLPNLSGDWSFNGNNYRTTLTLQHEGDRLSGTLYGVPMEDGRVLDDGTVTFIRTGVNQTYRGRFSVEPDGTWKLSGTFDCPVTRTTGSLWVATRDPRGGQAPTPTLPDRETVSMPPAPAPAPTPAPTPEPTPPALPDLPSPIDAIVGEWSVVMAMLDGPQPTTLSVERDGDGVVGTLDDRINAWLRLRAAGAGNNYTGTWTDPQAGTVAVTASITANGALIVKLVEATGGWDVLFNALRPRGGTVTAPAAPAPTQPGTSSVEELLVAGGLHHSPRREGGYTVPFDNGVEVVVEQIGESLLAYHHIGHIPGNTAEEWGDWAQEALRLNFSDTVGRMSLQHGNDGSLQLYWSCRVPLSAATGPYVKAITATGASQVERWRAVQRNEEPPDLPTLIRTGDREELFEGLKRHSNAAGLQFEEDDDRDVLRYDGYAVSAMIIAGTAWVYGFSGGMPGGTDAGRGTTALELLRRNWYDPVGRFSLDSDYDLLWESQLPMDYLTPQLLKYAHDVGTEQLDWISTNYGDIPFNH